MIPLLNEGKINYALVDSYWRVKLFDEIDSTQSYLAQRGADLRTGDVALAEFQSAGRGRLDRTFVAPKSSSLLLSFYYEPKRSRDVWGAIALIVGSSIAQLLGDEFSTKWPNDILHATGKVSGTLCEFAPDGVIVGIGINVAMQQNELPVATASSLLIATGNAPNRNDLVVSLLSQIKKELELWESGVDFTAEYSRRSSTIGSKVRALLPSGEVWEGRAQSVSSRGELILDSGQTVSVGDITHLK